MAICICVAALSLATVAFDLHHSDGAQVLASGPAPSARIELADARSYTHCHNLPRRTYCHKAERLPVNWPPNTSTPGTKGTSEGSETPG